MTNDEKIAKERRENEYACTLVLKMITTLHALGEKRWKVSTVNPGAVHVSVMAGEIGGSPTVHIQVSFQGKIADALYADGGDLYAAFRSLARKVQDHSTVPPSIQRHDMPEFSEVK